MPYTGNVVCIKLRKIAVRNRKVSIMDTKYKPGFALDFGMGMITSALPGWVNIIILRFIQCYDKPQSMNYIVAIVVYGMGICSIKINSEDLGWPFYLAYVISACIMIINLWTINV